MSTIAVDNARPSLGGTATGLITGLAKARALYDQTVPAVDSSENIASVTDDGVGISSFSFTNAMAAADDWQIVTSGGEQAGGSNAVVAARGSTTTKTASAWGISYSNDAGTLQDRDSVMWAVLGDLA